MANGECVKVIVGDGVGISSREADPELANWHHGWDLNRKERFEYTSSENHWRWAETGKGDGPVWSKHSDRLGQRTLTPIQTQTLTLISNPTPNFNPNPNLTGYRQSKP